MSTPKTPSVTNSPSSTIGASLLPTIGMLLEFLWLIAAFLIPLVYLGREYATSEALIAYIEVPKVALLRTIAGLVACLLLVEWAITSKAFQAPDNSNPIHDLTLKQRTSRLALAVSHWLNEHPVRWVGLATGLFFGITLVSTLLSASVTNSIWGEIPGQDGYSAYTVASYALLFGTIASHLKTPAQLRRLMGTIVMMGFLVGLYGIFQHYGNDFLGTVESSGGGATRVTIFMGNAIFAGALLSMTIPFTLIVSAWNFREIKWGESGFLSKIGQLERDWSATAIWAAILAVQLLGLMFTFSRGPWSGTLLALVAFLIIVAISLGSRILLRSGLVIGLASIFSAGLLHYQGSVSIINIGPWFGFFMAFIGLAGSFITLFVMARLGQAITKIAVIGIATTMLIGLLISPYALSERGPDNAGINQSTTSSLISERVSSIKTDVLGGFIGGRGTHWKTSWELAVERPWFEFDNLKLPWLRPMIGYGPDLFRYTYLLKSPPDDFRFLPLEPDHAHNFFIHQLVEQGVLGGATALAIFLSAFSVAVHQLAWRRRSNNPMYRLLMLGLMAIILGRFLEMMVGVARISDLTILWIIFGLFIAVSFLDKDDDQTHHETLRPLFLPEKDKNHPSTRSRNLAAQPPNNGVVLRLALVAVIVGGIGIVTFQKSINSVRAATAEGRALQHIENGDLNNSLEELNKAISLAPGVPSRHIRRAHVYLAYQQNTETITEPNCNLQTENPYLVCLGLESLQSNSDAVLHQPFYFIARLALANSAYNLKLNDIATESYQNASSMVPNSWAIKNDLAESQISLHQYEKALVLSEESLKITGTTEEASAALYFKGIALNELGKPNEAIAALKKGFSLAPKSVQHLNLIQVILSKEGLIHDIDYFTKIIKTDPGDTISYYLRGIAHLRRGDAELALSDITKSIERGMAVDEAYSNRGYASFKLGASKGDVKQGGQDLEAAIRGFNSDWRIRGEITSLTRHSLFEIAPKDALLNGLYAEYHMYQGNYTIALDFLNRASVLDPDLGLPHLLRTRVYLGLGLKDIAKESFDTFSELPLPTAIHYAERGQVLTNLSQPELGIMDFDLAININPNKATFYNGRGKALASLLKFDNAIADFNSAIEINPNIPEFYLNRGLVHELIGDHSLAHTDFEAAESLGLSNRPTSEAAISSFFTDYDEETINQVSPPLVGQLRRETVQFRTIDNLLLVEANDPSYDSALQMLGEIYLDLELWYSAVKSLTELIDRSHGNPETYRNRGIAYMALGNIDYAMDDFLQAVSQDSTSEENFIARGRAYSYLGTFELAVNDFNTAIDLNQTYSDAYKFRGSHLIRAKDFHLALDDLTYAIEISPDDDDAYHKRATAYMEIGQLANALADINKSIEIDISNPDYYLSRGRIWLESGDSPSALKDFSYSIELTLPYADTDPRFIEAYLERSEIYLKLNNPHAAITDASLAIDLLSAFGQLPEWEALYPSINFHISNGHKLQGDAYTMLGMLDDARISYKLASKIP